MAGLIGGTWGDEPNGVDDLICVRVADFDRARFAVVDAPPTMRAIEVKERAHRLLRKGDLLIEKSGGGDNQPVGCVVDFNQSFEAVCSNFIGRMPVAPGMWPRYWTYVHASLYSGRLNIPAIKQTTGIQNLDTDAYFNQRVPFPPHLEQRAIADYLDRETARLDALVAAKERVLGLLAEKRRAVITRAVTRGLPAEAAAKASLAPRVPLRDSGISWLGEIPTHWEIWKIGHLAIVGNGSTPNRDNSDYWADGTVPWLNSSVVNQDEVTAADQFISETALRECHLPIVKAGSVLVGITGQGKTRGTAAVLSFAATINQHLAYITPSVAIADTWFLRWVLFAAYDFLRSISDDAGGTKGALTCEEVAGIRVPLPPVSEQHTIAGYIAAEIAKLDAVRTATERTIALLKERRAALVAAAVTGKIDVQEAVA